MKEFTIDPNEIIYFKPRDVWCIPEDVLRFYRSSITQEEVFINKERYKIVGFAAIHKTSGPSSLDILFKKVTED